MSAFLTPLDVQEVNDLAASGRGFWKVTKPFRYYSDILGRALTIEPGFLTDYASVPRVPFAYWLLGDRVHGPAVIHDWLFHHHEVCDEQTANKVLLEAMWTDKAPLWCIFLIYLGVVIGGKSSWEADGAGNGHSIQDDKIV